MPAKKDERFNVLAYVGTQADKMQTAVTEVSKLLNNLPEAQKNFDMSKQSLLKGIESDWITRDQIYWAWQRAQRRGLDYDIRKDIYEQAQKMSMKDIHAFFDQHVKGKKYVYLVLGGKDDLDMKALSTLGPVKELTLEQIFGY
jgi:predicted Zn-dependent peptidase